MPMTSRFAVSHLFVCAAAFLSCDGAVPPPNDVDETGAALTGSGDVELIRTLKALEVSPNSAVVISDLGKTATRTFKVLARYNDRSTADVTATASYTVDNPSVGSMTGAVFETASRASAQVDFVQVIVRYREGGTELTARANLTVAWLRASGPNKDLLFTLPYMGRTESLTTGFGSSPQAVDAFLAVDTTGSMGGEINSIKSSLDTTIIPGVRSVVANSWFGVGAVEDFPSGSYGSPSCGGDPSDDQPFILLKPMTSDLTAFKTAFGQLLRGSSPRGCGADTPEGQMEALYQIATGNGNVVSGVVNVPAHKDKGRGGVEFRVGALPIVSMITDASFHALAEGRMCFGSEIDYAGAVAAAAHSRTTTTNALKNLCARVIGVSIETGSDANCIGHYDMTQMATATGGRVQPEAWGPTGTRPSTCATGDCCTGVGGKGEKADAEGLCPLVYKGQPDGSGIGAQVVGGIEQLVRFAPSDVTIAKSGGGTTVDGTSLPMGKNTADFLISAKAIDGTPPASPSGLMTPTASGDKFTGVVPGSTLRFSVDAQNTFLPATSKPQVLRAKLTTYASGCATLDEHDVFIVVPAA